MRVGGQLVVLLILAFLGYGVWVYTRLPSAPLSDGVQRYGFRPTAASDLVRIDQAVLQATGAPKPTVSVQGRVVDMGPTMGCWLLIEDGTGAVLVQTEPMVYMPQKLRGATVKVTGTLVQGRFAGMGYYRDGWFLFAPGVEVVQGG